MRKISSFYSLSFLHKFASHVQKFKFSDTFVNLACPLGHLQLGRKSIPVNIGKLFYHHQISLETNHGSPIKIRLSLLCTRVSNGTLIMLISSGDSKTKKREWVPNKRQNVNGCQISDKTREW